MKILPNVGRK